MCVCKPCMPLSVRMWVMNYSVCACVALCVHVSGSEACKLKFTVYVCVHVCLKERKKKGSYNGHSTRVGAALSMSLSSP